MSMQKRHELFEHYCASLSSFHHAPTFTDYSAGFDAGIAQMQAEIDTLKRQIVTFRYGQKMTEDGVSRLATLEALNRALLRSLAEMNEGK